MSERRGNKKMELTNKLEDQLQDAIAMLDAENCSFVLWKEGQEEQVSTEIGVKPIMNVLRSDEEGLQDGVVADKVIGKAAALLLVLGGAKAVYGRVMSEGGKTVLEQHGIVCRYGSLVPYIENRTQTGMCPLEASVQEVEDPKQARVEIEKTIAKLMAAR